MVASGCAGTSESEKEQHDRTLGTPALRSQAPSPPSPLAYRGFALAAPYAEFSTAAVDIAVNDCVGNDLLVEVRRRKVLLVLPPLAFTPIYDQDWNKVALTFNDGTSVAPEVRSQALSARWDPVLARPLLTLDTGPLALGRYRLTILLGNGETVVLRLLVTEEE